MEYHLCQRHADTSSRRSWQSAGILLAAALAGLTILVGGYISNLEFMSSLEPRSVLIIRIAMTGLAVVMVSVLTLLITIVRREVFFQHTCHRRMREIEEKLGLRRAIYTDILDNWPERKDNPYWGILSEDEKSNLENNYTKKGDGAPRPTTRKATYIIILIVQFSWAFFCLFIWLYG